jgi:NitT/TauT family transport system ATP-binding protein
MFLSINQVDKSFRTRGIGDQKDGGQPDSLKVLSDINLGIAKGEFVCLLGSSGCGKTTLLRVIAGLIKADTGEIIIEDRPVEQPRRNLCMVFQNFGLLPWRTVEDNVMFPLELDHMPKAERLERANRFLELVGLGGFEKHYPHEISGGMQQRVGIARALVRGPAVLLMDEPFAALDAQTREVLQEDFLKIWRELGTTVVFVTHSIDEALVLADRIVVMTTRPGRVREIIESPFASLRLEGDIRGHAEFSKYRQHIRGMLAMDHK